jgi:acetyltransferase-like isoleucine patch superfamily enzyme
VRRRLIGGNVTVRTAASLGMNSSIRKGLTVGEEAVLGGIGLARTTP